jgi:hypothetical protein
MTDTENTVIADGDPVGISSEVLKDPVDPIEGGFAIDDPLLVIELASESLKVPGLLERADATREYEGTRLEAFLEKVKELAFEQRRYHPDRDEETFAA